MATLVEYFGPEFLHDNLPVATHMEWYPLQDISLFRMFFFFFLKKKRTCPKHLIKSGQNVF